MLKRSFLTGYAAAATATAATVTVTGTSNSHNTTTSAAAVAAARAANNNRTTRVLADLRSDTITQPCQAMRDFMLASHCREATLVEELETRVADLCGKEAGLFLPSGSMSNLTALMTCSQGELSPEVVVGSMSHVHNWEAGSAASIGRIYCRTASSTASNGELPLQDLLAAINTSRSDGHRAVTTAVVLENTHGDCGGRVLPLSYTQAVAAALRALPLGKRCRKPWLHCDGARLWNAAARYAAEATGSAESKTSTTKMISTQNSSINNKEEQEQHTTSDGREWLALAAADYDSVSLCLSKGMGAPVGSVLVGPTTFIKEARNIARRRLGGDMSGGGAILAAAGLFALRNNHWLERATRDNNNAAVLAGMLRDRGIVVQPVESNMVVFRTAVGRASEVVAAAKEKEGILAGEMDASSVRLVLNLHVEGEEQLQHVADGLARVCVQ